jgi:hypothetical protein
MWNVDAYAEVVAVVGPTPTPTPTPTSTPPIISDPWVIAIVISAVIMAAALVAVAIIVRR